MNRAIRAHHLLCMQLFVGKGYNDNFSFKMGQYIQDVQENPYQELLIQKREDEICKYCPNQIIDKITNKKGCLLSTSDVIKKDETVLSILELEAEHAYSYITILKQMKKKITEPAFYQVCGTCRWHKKGLCTYEKLEKSIIDKNEYIVNLYHPTEE